MTASNNTAPAASGVRPQPEPFIALGVSRDLDDESELRERAARFFVLMSLGGLLLGVFILVLMIRAALSLGQA